MLKKIKFLAIAVILLVTLLPSFVIARGLVPEGVTLQGWTTTPNNEGKSTMINLKYTDGYSDAILLDSPFNSSWYPVNDVRAFIQAYKEGWGPDLGGEGGILGTDINFAPNVLAAMKAQNFNPAQVGGANIPPESTVLNEDQIAWLQKGGYPIPTETPASMPVETESAPVTQPEAEKQNVETEVKTEPISTAVEPVTVTPDPKPEVVPKAEASDPVGQTVQTPATAMTNEMAEESKQLAAADPPKVNEPKVSDDIAKQISEQNEQKDTNNTVLIGAVSAVVVLATIAGTVHLKRKA